MSLDEMGYLRLPQIIGCKRKGIPALYPVSKSNWWAGVASRRYPAPVKLSARVTAWRVTDVRKLLSRVAEEGK